MASSLETTHDVRDAINDLRNALHADEMWNNGGISAQPAEFRRAWLQLDASLRAADGVIKAPVAGQGLSSIWLKIVLQKAARAQEASENHYTNGWEGAIFHNDENLFWLVTNGWQTGYALVKFLGTGPRQLASLLEVERSPLERLRALSQQTPATDRLPASDTEIGILLLKAVDALEVGREWLSDEQFCQEVVANLDMPAGLTTPYLPVRTGQGVLALVEKFAPKTKERTDPAPSKPYPRPKLYARDKWIYENIASHTCQTLSVALKKLAARNAWHYIDSRNALKGAAKRYAGYHELPIRGFADDGAGG